MIDTDISKQNKAKATWQNWEAKLLLHAYQRHQLVTVFLTEDASICQTIILGIDLYASELLLDRVYPSSPRKFAKLKRTLQPFWIQIKHHDEYFRLKVCFTDQIEQNHNDILTVKVLETEITDSRRWNPRFYFPKRQGPKVDLQIKYQANIDGWLSNVSRKGCLVELYGPEIRAQNQDLSNVSCIFQFSEDFALTLSCNIKQWCFYRKPCFHTLVRMQFNDMPPEKSTLLEALLESIRIQSQSPESLELERRGIILQTTPSSQALNAIFPNRAA